MMNEPRARSLPSSARFHAICGDIAKQARFGQDRRKLTQQQWKVLMCSAHAIATGLPSDLVEGLEGEFVELREPTAKMMSGRMASLIDYATCWAVQNHVTLRD